MLKKVVLYARVSSKEQAEEGFSIDAQIRYLKEYAVRNKMDIVKEFVESESAKQTGRAQFDNMLSFLSKSKDVKIIIVEKTDRLTRNFVDHVRLDPKVSGIEIHYAKEGKVLDKNSNPSDFFMQDIQVAMANYTSRNIGREASKGMLEKARQGYYPSHAPYGYINNRNNGLIEPDPITASFVTKTFELASTGMYSLRLLCERMFEHGMKTKTNTPFSPANVHVMLNRQIYNGSFSWNGELFIGKHQPLVTPELFDRVQVVMGYRKKPRIVKRSFLFSGLFTCGKCGCSITPEFKQKKSGKQYVYYHCTNGKKICAVKPSISEDKLDEAICNALEEITIPSEIIEWTREALKASFADEKKFMLHEQQNLSFRRSKLQRLIDQAYEDKVDGILSSDEWLQKTNSWKKEQAELDARLAKSREYNLDYMLEGVRTLELAQKAPILYKSMTNDEKRELINIVLSNSNIVDGKPQFIYKKPFDLLVKVDNLSGWLGNKDSNLD